MFRPIAADATRKGTEFPPSPVTYSDLYRELQGIRTLMDQQRNYYSPWETDAADNFKQAHDDLREVQGLIEELLEKYDPKSWTPQI